MGALGAGVNRTMDAEIRVIYRTTLPDVYGYLLAHCGGDHELAQDLTSDTYYQAVDRFQTGFRPNNPTAWLKTVAQRRLVDHWRRRTTLDDRMRQIRNELVVSQQRQETDEIADQADIREALNQLEPDQRLVLVLKHVDAMSVKEIATTIGRTPKATESLLGRARTAFRQHYLGGEHG